MVDPDKIPEPSPPIPDGFVFVTVGKPFGEMSRGDHEYVILVQGTNLIFSPSGITTCN